MDPRRREGAAGRGTHAPLAGGPLLSAARLGLLLTLALAGCHDWASLSSAWEGEGVCTAYVVTGPSHTCARMTNGAMYCWGDNRFGQLGLGDTVPRNRPTKVDFAELGVAKIYLPAGDGEVSSDTGVFTCAVTTDNVLRCWGGNRFGQLGVGDLELRPTPTRVQGLSSDVARASNGGGHTCAQTSDGKLWCWGKNLGGQLGLGTTTPELAPRQVDVGGLSVERLATGANFTCARGADGSLWCWGENSVGQLGLGDLMPRSAPTRVMSVGTSLVRLVSGGAHTCALGTDGLASCWGDNRFGQLGVDDTTARPTPTPVGGQLGTVTQVFAGGTHSCALRSDNTLWCWGDNRSGQLGVGDTQPRALPVQVAALGDQVAGAWAGGAHTCAVKADGSVWCWGNNQYGQTAGAAGPRAETPVQLFPPCQ